MTVGLTRGRVSKVWLEPGAIPARGRNSVSIGPGQTAKTLIPRGRSSERSAFERLKTYALVEQYTAIRVFGAKAAMEQVLTISPPFFIYGSDTEVITVSASQ